MNAALVQLRDWCNLESHPDTSRVSSLSDFYRARFLYRLSQGGEAVEAALALFVETLQRRAELQTVALEDIASRLQALHRLGEEPQPDAAKIHETLRDLVRVFESLADNVRADVRVRFAGWLQQEQVAETLRVAHAHRPQRHRVWGSGGNTDGDPRRRWPAACR